MSSFIASAFAGLQTVSVLRSPFGYSYGRNPGIVVFKCAILTGEEVVDYFTIRKDRRICEALQDGISGGN